MTAKVEQHAYIDGVHWVYTRTDGWTVDRPGRTERRCEIYIREYDAWCVGCSWRIHGISVDVEGAAEFHAFIQRARIRPGWSATKPRAQRGRRKAASLPVKPYKVRDNDRAVISEPGRRANVRPGSDLPPGTTGKEAAADYATATV